VRISPLWMVQIRPQFRVTKGDRGVSLQIFRCLSVRQGVPERHQLRVNVFVLLSSSICIMKKPFGSYPSRQGRPASGLKA
jgi:hypothetical protein